MRVLFTVLTSVWLLYSTAVITVGQGAADPAKVDLEKLSKDVTSKDKETSLQAIDELGTLGAAAAPALGSLIRALANEDLEVRWHAARTLGAIGPGAADAVPALTKGLGDEDSSVRAYSAFALGRIGKPAEPAVDLLIKNAFDTQLLVRRASIRALRLIDPPTEKTMPLVLEILEKGDMDVIMPALHTLAEEGKAAVPRLRKALQHEKAQNWACIVLAEIGPDAAEAVPELTELVGHKDPDVRMQAILALGEIGSASEPAVPSIIKTLKEDEFTNVRDAAAYALGKIKAKGPAEDALREALSSSDELLRTISAWALARTNPDDKELVDRAVRMIVEAFKSKDVAVRRAAARAAVEFDIAPQLIAPALVDALKDKDQTVVANAIDALSAMGPKALKNIDSAIANKELRHYAVRLVARIGPEGEAAVPALVKELGKKIENDDDAEFIREAQFALAQIGPNARDAVPALVKSLASDRDDINASAAFALGRIGPEARAAVPALRIAMASDKSIVKLASLRALMQIQPGQRQLAVAAVPLLMKALDAEQELIRVEAATALGEFGQLAKPAVARLKELEKDESQVVREAAADAVKKIGG